MKNLKQIIKESLGHMGDTTTYEPESKGEKEFVAMHTDNMKVTDYPVADAERTFKATNVSKDHTHNPHPLENDDELDAHIAALFPEVKDNEQVKRSLGQHESVLNQLNAIIESGEPGILNIRDSIDVDLTPEEASAVYDLVIEHAVNGSVNFDSLFKKLKS